MSRSSRRLARRLRRSIEPAGAPLAGDELRERVLASVYGGEDHCEPRSYVAPSRPAAHLAALTTGLAIAAAFGVKGTVAPHLSAAPHQQAPASLRTVSRVPDASAHLHLFGARAELTVGGMPQPPIGRSYQLWLQGAGSEPRATDALFVPSRTGDATVDVPGGMGGAREVIVASVPLGGSSHLNGAAAVLRVILSGSS